MLTLRFSGGRFSPMDKPAAKKPANERPVVSVTVSALEFPKAESTGPGNDQVEK
jgi:hypothetical protein